MSQTSQPLRLGAGMSAQAAALQARLSTLGVVAKVVGAALRLSPASKVPPDLLAEVRSHKAALIALLTAPVVAVAVAPRSSLGLIPADPGYLHTTPSRPSLPPPLPSPWRTGRPDRGANGDTHPTRPAISGPRYSVRCPGLTLLAARRKAIGVAAARARDGGVTSGNRMAAGAAQPAIRRTGWRRRISRKCGHDRRDLRVGYGK